MTVYSCDLRVGLAGEWQVPRLWKAAPGILDASDIQYESGY